jgi:hypothetical protein
MNTDSESKMSEPFDPEKYEQLRGLQLGSYAIEVAKHGNLPPNCIEYVKANAERWDGQHLEMGMFFLSKINSKEARRQIASYLDHPLKHIRYTALGLVEHMEHSDEFILSKLTERLAAKTDDFEKPWIKQVHEKITKRINSRLP